MGNNALNVNPNTNNGGTAGIAITTHGSDWYWVGLDIEALRGAIADLYEGCLRSDDGRYLRVRRLEFL